MEYEEVKESFENFIRKAKKFSEDSWWNLKDVIDHFYKEYGLWMYVDLYIPARDCDKDGENRKQERANRQDSL